MKESEKENNADSHANSAQAEVELESESGKVEEIDTDKNEEISLEQTLEAAEQKAKDNWDQLLRTKAEMDNLRKRQSKELENAHKFALERFVGELLPVKDSMELGLQAATDTADITKLVEGMELTLKMMTSCLDKTGLEIIAPEQGDKLNPEVHQAMSLQESSEFEPNSVLTVVQKGYSLNGRLIRPAMVIVAKAQEASASKEESNNEEKESDSSSKIDEQA